MTPNKINKALAEKFGWRDVVDHGDGDIVGTPPGGGARTALPHYAESMDALLPEVEKWCAARRRLPLIRIELSSDGHHLSYWVSVKGHLVINDNPATALALAALHAMEVEEGR